VNAQVIALCHRLLLLLLLRGDDVIQR